MAARKKKHRNSEWGWRLMGVVLCAFFGLGLYAGLAVANHAGKFDALSRISSILAKLHLSPPRLVAQRIGDNTVAMVERGDGFYTLTADGDVRGPVAARAIGNLPVISGTALEGVRGSDLLDYAALVVRAEAGLSELISEIRIGSDGTATLYLDRTHTELVLDLDRAGLELSRATAVMSRWRSHLDLVTALDMTSAGEAVVRLREPVTVALQEIGLARQDPNGGRQQAPR